MKRLILPTLALLTILAVYSGCTENESEPVITRLHVAPQCGVVPVRVDGRKGSTLVETDEHPRSGASLEGLAKLRPAG